MSKKSLAFIIGPTCAGKGTFIDYLVKEVPKVHLVQVGKMMRAKYLDPASPHYQPNYFKGSAAPSHTEKEAWQMMLDGIAAAPKGTHSIIVDGQPRTVHQALRVRSLMEDFEVTAMNVYAPVDVRMARSQERDGKNPDALALSQQRVLGDLPALYEVISVLGMLGVEVHHLMNFRLPAETIFNFTMDDRDAFMKEWLNDVITSTAN